MRELLDDLTVRLPASASKVYDGEEIRPYVNVYVDGEDVRTSGGLDAPVRETPRSCSCPPWRAGDAASLARFST